MQSTRWYRLLSLCSFLPVVNALDTISCYAYFNDALEPARNIGDPDENRVCYKKELGKTIEGPLEKKNVCRPIKRYPDGEGYCPADMTLAEQLYEVPIFPRCRCDQYRNGLMESSINTYDQLCMTREESEEPYLCHRRHKIYVTEALDKSTGLGERNFAFGSFFGCSDNMVPCEVPTPPPSASPTPGPSSSTPTLSSTPSPTASPTPGPSFSSTPTLSYTPSPTASPTPGPSFFGR